MSKEAGIPASDQDCLYPYKANNGRICWAAWKILQAQLLNIL